jgi:hypothetical protein
MNCRVKGCQEPPGPLVATVKGQNESWHFCLRHFWQGVHKLLDRNQGQVIVSGLPGVSNLAVLKAVDEAKRIAE